MHKQDDSQQNAELRQAFLRHLPKRLDTLTRRGLRQARDGWDINSLSLIFREVQTLAGASGRYGLLDLAEKLFAIESALSDCLEQVRIPEPQVSSLVGDLFEQVREIASARNAATPVVDNRLLVSAADLDRSENGYPLQLMPPADYWKRFPEVVTASSSNVVPIRVAVADADAGANSVAATVPTAATAPAAGSADSSSAATTVKPAANARKVYHLTDGSTFACEIDQKLELSGYELSLLDHMEELIEMIRTFPPHLVVVDAHFLDALDQLGEALKSARTRSSHRVALLALSEQAELDVRLRAMRAGADAFIPLPANTADVMARIAELTESDQSDPYRIMIVEDDRSQAMFAESILRKAGMITTMVTDPLAVLGDIDQFNPDLILMDLYMPGCSGMELTAIIREREAFVSTPIVFLSGESDTDKHFEALNAGGDDFLSKPIRPKHLISAVTNRLRRARHIRRRAQNQNPRDPITGMYERAHVLDRINAKLAADENIAQRGGLLFVELDDATNVREQVGLIGFDKLLGQIGAFLAGHLDAGELVTRFGDTSFIVLSPDRSADELAASSGGLADRVAREQFDVDGQSYSVRLSIGICPFAANLGDAGSMLNAAERAMSESRKPEHDSTSTAGAAQSIGVFAPKASGDAALLENIRNALRSDGFHLVFQPIASLSSDDENETDEQFQALLRLHGDDGKLLTASHIVPLAEQAGLIDDIDRWVLSRCLMVISERARQGRSVRLFVSQSFSAAADSSRIGWLRQQLETRRIHGNRLVLELRLPQQPADRDAISGFAAAVHQIGIGVCLSGATPGENVQSAVEHLQIDFIKLAPECIADRSPRMRDELRRLVHSAHEHGRKVIAPRIEDAQSAATLWTVGVDFIQGNFVQHEAQNLDYDFRAAAG
ncbi:diguanylate cyclase (GGDEF)-like protein [Tahibacter aquaticus]|uniref:Diguanylate cyclase (GGDEF)-like protein n=1 Tax=Tahibacter aquaticus TaxID=520092 RepID=A0A4R6YV49_9GAMM|nr:EAL domain-containing protein [Tahibacter aquaticus]TDR42500.1 diguanylate cyclase (GGDEF)-like protein [Tahibacter aquaticus]